MQQTTYSKTFKIEAVKKVLSRGYGTSVTDVAKALDLPKSTLYRWVEAMKNKEPGRICLLFSCDHSSVIGRSRDLYCF